MLIALCILAIGLSAGAQLALTMFFWGMAHSAPPATTQHVAIQGLVCIGALGWVVMTPFRWRTHALELAGLAAVTISQLCGWEVLRRYDFIREWSLGPAVLLSIAVISVAFGFGPFVYRPATAHSTVG